MGWKSSNFD